MRKVTIEVLKFTDLSYNAQVDIALEYFRPSDDKGTLKRMWIREAQEYGYASPSILYELKTEWFNSYHNDILKKFKNTEFYQNIDGSYITWILSL